MGSENSNKYAKNIKYTKLDALDALPPMQQAVQIMMMFNKVENKEQFFIINDRWMKVKIEIMKYYENNKCKYGKKTTEIDFVIDEVSKYTGKNISLILNIAQLFVHFLSHESDEASKEIQEIIDEIKKIAVSTVVEKSSEKVFDKIDPLVKKMKEKIIKMLVKYGRRSKKYYNEMIGSIVSILSYGSVVGVVLNGVFSPEEISPEWCGIIEQVDEAQSQSMSRIFKHTNYMR